MLPAVVFFAGLLLIFIRWPFFGLIAQLVGVFLLFKYPSCSKCDRSFIANAFNYAKSASPIGSGSISRWLTALVLEKEGIITQFMDKVLGGKSTANTV